jgi:hypothetical protein
MGDGREPKGLSSGYALCPARRSPCIGPLTESGFLKMAVVHAKRERRTTWPVMNLSLLSPVSVSL